MIATARGTARLLHLGSATLAWVAAASLHQAVVPEARRGPVFQRYMKLWASSLVHATGGRVELAPGSRLPDVGGPRLVVSNHRSPFDIGVLLSLFGGHALSRADVSRWPVLGLAARRAGTIFVDREDGSSRASALRAIRRRLKEGASILVFPEGGTFEGDEVRPFKPGAFAALRGLDAQVVPVGIAYDHGCEYTHETFVEHVVRVAGRRETRCVVKVGAPLPARGSDAQTLADCAQREVQRLVDDARAHWFTSARAQREAKRPPRRSGW